MSEKLKHFPVNWIDGMKINKNHFLSMQHHGEEMVKDAISARLTPLNYGLLPLTGSQSSIRLKLVVDAHQLLKVNVQECHAITPNGSRIEIDGAIGNAMDESLPYPEAMHNLKPGEQIELFACISVNGLKRVAFGELDPNENPPRYPFTQPEYLLHLIASENIRKDSGLGNSFLIVGKIMVNGTETSIDESYIPPSTTVSSHPYLLEDHANLDKFLGQLEIYANQISQKINGKEQGNVLSQLLDTLCDKILSFLGGEINAFRWFAPSAPPARMYAPVIALARVLKNYIDSRSGSGKEELLNYFAEWCNIPQGDFELLFHDTINVGYHHNYIDVTSKQVFKFADALIKLFATLTRLDYIGRRKDSSIYVAEITDENQKIVTSTRRNKTFISQ